MFVDDENPTVISTLEDLRGAAERNFDLHAVSIGQHPDHGELKAIAGHGQVRTQKLHADHSQPRAYRGFWTKELALSPHPHQPRRFGAAAVGGEATRGRRIEFF